MSDVRTIVIDKDPYAIGLEYADVKEKCSIKDYEKVLSLARMWNVDGAIAPCADAGLMSLGTVNSAMNLKGPSMLSINATVDKRISYMLFKKVGLNVPERYSSLSTAECPYVIKPADGVGSRGVYVVDSFINDATPYYERAMDYSESKEVVIEEYISGTVFNVDFLLQNGQVLYYLMNDELFDEGKRNFGVDVFVCPSEYVGKNMLHKILKDAIKAVNAVGIADGNVAVEGIVYKDKPYILEINPRMSGGRHMETHQYASDIDWIADGINVVLGNTIPKRRCCPTPHAWAMIGSKYKGKITGISGFEGALLAWIVKDVGGKILPFNDEETSTDQTVLIVYTNGDSREDSLKRIQDIRNTTQIEVQ